MKFIPRVRFSGRVFAAGLLIGFSGCAEVTTRQSTSEMSSSLVPLRTDLAGIEVPTPLRTVHPEYPIAMKRAGISGTVRLNCLVDEHGGVQAVRVIDSTDERFAQPAVNAVRQWTFTPGRRNGVAAPMHVSFPVQFNVQDD